MAALQREFYCLIAAQFASALADNALLLVVIAMLQANGVDAFWIPLLKLLFTLSYVVCGPWVGSWSDHQPKHAVMMWANGLKLCACASLVIGLDPILAFAFTGLGAAIYAPAKYGLITEMVKADQLVHANAWIEVSAISAALLGVMLGGAGVSSPWREWLASTGWRCIFEGPVFVETIALICCIYLLSALFNVFIPDMGKRYRVDTWHVKQVLQNFYQDQCKLWRDPLGGISLFVTTLLWGVGACMQLLVLSWAQRMLALSLSQAAYLQASTAIGVVIGAILAARHVSLKNAPSVLVPGLVMGATLPLMLWIHQWQWALLLTLGLGVLSGFVVVPMNALLQARGVQLLSAGRSIAVQNTSENSSILLMLGGYAFLEYAHWPIEHLVFAVAGLIFTGVGHALWRYRQLSLSTAA